MKIDKKILITFICAVIVVLLCVGYFVVIYPTLNLLGNSLPETVSSNEPVLEKGENVLDISSILNNSEEDTQEEDSEADNEESDGESFVSDGLSSGEASSSADPLVSGVTQINGNTLHFEEDAYNVLVIGQDNSSGLADTIMIISICDRLNTVQVASIARDAYIPYSQTVIDALDKNGYGNSAGIFKINASMFVGSYVLNYQDGIFDNQGINFMCSILNEMLPDANCEIDEYICMNQNGFMKIIDIVGGIDVYVTEDFYNGNGMLIWSQGYHHMNSDECFTYISRRTRYGSEGRLSSSGDPYRKANQLSFMRDFAKQAVTVENIPKLPSIMSSLSQNVWHSFNSASDISTYSDFALKFAKQQYSMSMYVVTGESIDPVGDGASYVNLLS